MIRLRPYKDSDAEKILAWCADEKSFYQWTAGVMGDFPLTREDCEAYEILGETWKCRELEIDL